MTESLPILVIDDDPLQLELLERALARDGFEIRAISSIAELPGAVAGFAHALVLCDVNLPDAEPAEAIRAVREATGAARIVLYSSWEDSKLRNLVLRTGADAFISKSESVMTIGRRLRELQRK